MGLFIYQYRCIENLKENFHAGSYLFAITSLILLRLNDSNHKLNAIDYIIQETLYNKYVDEKWVFKELELATIGLRLSKFLIDNNLKYISEKMRMIIQIYGNMYTYFINPNFSNYPIDLMKSTINFANELAHGLVVTFDYFVDMEKLSYGKNDSDSYKKDLDKIIHTLRDFLQIHNEIKNKFFDETPEAFVPFFIKKYEDIVNVKQEMTI